MPHVIKKQTTRASHRLRIRPTHGDDSAESELQGGESSASQSSKDAIFGRINLMPGSIDTGMFATGATITDLINGPATVTINDLGITIEDGALILKDEFGTTVLVASGFSGSWFDFTDSRLYNGMFRAGVAGTVPAGRTASLPYWTLSLSGTGTMTYSAPGATGNGSVQGNYGALSDTIAIASDITPVDPNGYYMLRCFASANTTAGTATLTAYADFYHADGVTLTSTVTVGTVLSSTGSNVITPSMVETDTFYVPSNDSYFVRVRFVWTESGSHNAANHIFLLSAALVKYDSATPEFRGLTVSAGGQDFHIDSTGAVTKYQNDTFTTYVPTVTGGGTVTWTVRSGWYYTIGKMVFICINLSPNAGGSGGSTVTVSLPLTADSTLGQTVYGSRAGSGATGAMSCNIGTTTITQIRQNDLTVLTGADLDAAVSLRIEGWYLAA